MPCFFLVFSSIQTKPKDRGATLKVEGGGGGVLNSDSKWGVGAR